MKPLENNMKYGLLFFLLLFVTSVYAQYNDNDIYRYINNYKEIAIQDMFDYKIPASITIAQGIFESGCGKSHLAVDGNNHFGIKCHNEWIGDTLLIDDDTLQECFRKYPSVEESFKDHSLFLTTRKRYSNLFTLDILDYQSWARTLKADGYATNPQYATRLIDLIKRYNIARLDTIYLIRSGGGVSTVAQNQPAPVTPIPSSQNGGNFKAYTVIGNDYPTGNSPFTFRKVFENNRTFFIIAQKGDTYEQIAGDVQVAASSLRKFNDAGENGQPVENEIVYIEAKSKSNPTKIHIVQKNETLRYLSQRYGIQLQYLYKYNNLNENSVIKPGDQILLKH